MINKNLLKFLGGVGVALLFVVQAPLASIPRVFAGDPYAAYGPPDPYGIHVGEQYGAAISKLEELGFEFSSNIENRLLKVPDFPRGATGVAQMERAANLLDEAAKWRGEGARKVPFQGWFDDLFDLYEQGRLRNAASRLRADAAEALRKLRTPPAAPCAPADPTWMGKRLAKFFEKMNVEKRIREAGDRIKDAAEKAKYLANLRRAIKNFGGDVTKATSIETAAVQLGELSKQVAGRVVRSTVVGLIFSVVTGLPLEVANLDKLITQSDVAEADVRRYFRDIQAIYELLMELIPRRAEFAACEEGAALFEKFYSDPELKRLIQRVGESQLYIHPYDDIVDILLGKLSSAYYDLLVPAMDRYAAANNALRTESSWWTLKLYEPYKEFGPEQSKIIQHLNEMNEHYQRLVENIGQRLDLANSDCVNPCVKGAGETPESPIAKGQRFCKGVGLPYPGPQAGSISYGSCFVGGQCGDSGTRDANGNLVISRTANYANIVRIQKPDGSFGAMLEFCGMWPPSGSGAVPSCPLLDRIAQGEPMFSAENSAVICGSPDDPFAWHLEATNAFFTARKKSGMSGTPLSKPQTTRSDKTITTRSGKTINFTPDGFLQDGFFSKLIPLNIFR